MAYLSLYHLNASRVLFAEFLLVAYGVQSLNQRAVTCAFQPNKPRFPTIPNCLASRFASSWDRRLSPTLTGTIPHPIPLFSYLTTSARSRKRDV